MRIVTVGTYTVYFSVKLKRIFKKKEKKNQIMSASFALQFDGKFQIFSYQKFRRFHEISSK